MEFIAKILLWAVWNAASILALPFYALKHCVKSTIALCKDWHAARKALEYRLMPWRKEKENKKVQIKEESK